MAFNVTFFNSAKFFNNAQNQLEFTTETRFARYRSKFSLILGIKKNFASLKKILTFYASSIQQISIFVIFVYVLLFERALKNNNKGRSARRHK